MLRILLSPMSGQEIDGPALIADVAYHESDFFNGRLVLVDASGWSLGSVHILRY